MTTKGPNGRYVTNNWLLGILMFLVLAVGGFFLTDVWAQLRILKDSKVDKEQYKCDVSRIEGKIDQLIDWHVNKGK